MTENWQRGGFGLYLHWPFCQAKCPYCDFNSHVAGEIDESRWNRAYLSEIARLGAEMPDRVLSTVFLGGGTPSLMSPDLVGSVIEAIRGTWRTANDLEITLEANPTSVEAGRFAGYRDGGVTRVSIGMQALNDEDLRRLGRLHSAREARAAVDLARKTFGRISFDLIYARQYQTVEAWRAELEEALSFAGDHLSLYQLTIEDGTAFGERHARGKLPGLPDEDAQADMYALTQELTAAAGFEAYEVSNHARNADFARHNLIYWRSGDYAGIGPGAHGRLTLGGTRYATETPLSPIGWLTQVERTGTGETPRRALDAGDVLGETLMMGLRLNEGIEIGTLPLVDDVVLNSKINGLTEIGMLEISGGRLRATAAGRPVLNSVTAELLA